MEGSTLSVLSAASTASHLLPPQERLREKAFEYCQRLIEQSNRRESGPVSHRVTEAGPGSSPSLLERPEHACLLVWRF